MMLMEEAERIARDEHGSSRLAVISGETRCSLIKSLMPTPEAVLNMYRNCNCTRSKHLNRQNRKDFYIELR